MACFKIVLCQSVSLTLTFSLIYVDHTKPTFCKKMIVLIFLTLMQMTLSQLWTELTVTQHINSQAKCQMNESYYTKRKYEK